MKRIRVGIIGQGRSGRNIHGSYLSGDTRRYRIVAVADPMRDRRSRARAEFGCDVCADWRDLLARDDLDLIVNTTPSHLHVSVSLAALKAGFDVVCEKPLARTAREVDRLIAAAGRAGKVLAVFQQRRYDPTFRQVRKVIDSGVLGRIVQISMAMSGFSRRWDWQTLQANNGGNLGNTGPHGLDQALQLFGTDATPEVTCFMDRANTFGDAEDHVFLTLRGEGRPFITYEVSSCNAYPTCSWNVSGMRGGLIATRGKVEWRFFKLSEAPRQRLRRKPISNPEGMPAYCREKLKWYARSWQPVKPKRPASSQSGRFYRMLHAALTEGALLEITPRQVRQQIAVIEQCRRQNPAIYGRRMP